MANELSKPAAQEKKLPTIREYLSGEGFAAEVAKVLPAVCTPQRFTRVALTTLTRTPKLAQCDQASFFRCLFDLAQWGLEPDGRRAHLIPFENRKRGVTECQLIIDYKGLVELVYRSGVVSSIHADVVRRGDVFVYNLGEISQHVPWFLRVDDGKPKAAGEVYAAYARCVLKDGATKTEVLSHDEIDGIRKRSRAAQSGPWVSDWAEMAKKTAFRRLSKWLPLSAEVRDVMDRDDDVVEPLERVRKPITELAAFSFVSDQPDPDPTAARIESHVADETRPEPDKAGLDIDAFRKALAECKTAADVRVCCMEAAKTCGNPDEDATVEKEGKMRLDELKGGGK
jgi:recombination protein RecT